MNLVSRSVLRQLLAAGGCGLLLGSAQAQFSFSPAFARSTNATANVLRHPAATNTPFAPQLGLSPNPVAPGGPGVQLADTEARLRQILALDPKHIDANLRLALIEARRRHPDVARQHLERVADRDPRAAWYLAQLCAPERQTNEANAWLRQAATQFAAALAKATNDAPGLRLPAARTQVALGDYPAAVAILSQGRLSRDRPLYRIALADLYAQWAAATSNHVARLAILTRGNSGAAPTPRFLREWAILARATNEVGIAARREIERRLTDSNQAPAWLNALASYAWERGDRSEARDLFLRAIAQAPHDPNLRNNAALFLSEDPDPTAPARALELIEAALLVAPEEPEYRDTRGQVYLALGRPAQALVDLEAVVDKVADPAATHRAIARAYRALGRTAEAAQHETTAREIGDARPSAAWEERPSEE
jgi:Tfp pilus assembly protein PilF